MSRTIAAASGSSGRNRGVLMLAALFGILSAALVLAFLSSQDGTGEGFGGLPADESTVSVLVLTKNVEVGEVITDDMVTTRNLPRSIALPSALNDRSQIVGKLATAPLFEGEQVLQPKVTTYEGQNTLSFKVPNGMRALSVMVPHEAWIVGGLVQPGDRVDVMAIITLVTTDPLTGDEETRAGAGIIAENVEVLAVSQQIIKSIPNTDVMTDDGAEAETGTDTAAGAGDFAKDPTEEAESYEKSVSVTLAVTPEQAAYIGVVDAMRDDVAQYRLLVRQKGDDSPLTGVSQWTLNDILGVKQ